MREYSAGMYPYTSTEYGFDVHTGYVQREMREYSAGMYPYTATERGFGVHTGYVQQQQQRARRGCTEMQKTGSLSKLSDPVF